MGTIIDIIKSLSLPPRFTHAIILNLVVIGIWISWTLLGKKKRDKILKYLLHNKIFYISICLTTALSIILSMEKNLIKNDSDINPDIIPTMGDANKKHINEKNSKATGINNNNNLSNLPQYSLENEMKNEGFHKNTISSQELKIKEIGYWEIGKLDNSNIEFDNDCLTTTNKEEGKWLKSISFDVNEDIRCFPGWLCEKTSPQQIRILFRRKIDKPILLTIRFIGEKKPSLPLSVTPTPCFSATIDGHSLSNTNIETESDKKSQSYEWTEKKIPFNKKLESELHEISLSQQKGCIKFDYLKLEEVPSN